MRPADRSSGDDPTPLMPVKTEQEAAIICGALRSSGIRCAYLRRRDLAGSGSVIGGLADRPRRELRYVVMVDAGDLEDARAIVQESTDGFEPDEHEADWLPD